MTRGSRGQPVEKQGGLSVRILEARKARVGRSKVPYYVFLDKLEIAEKLHERIRSRIHDSALLREARGQFIVSCVTAIEVYFREMLRIGIDSKFIPVEKLPGHSEKQFSYDDFFWFKEKRVTIGEIISPGYHFQNMGEIKQTFTAALGEDFSNALKKTVYDCPDHHEEERLVDDYYPRVQELMRIRHSFVHEVDRKIRIRSADLDDMVDAAAEFAFYADLVFARSWKAQSMRQHG